MSNVVEEELRRLRRVVDQMASGHARLRDECGGRALLMDIGNLVGSAIIASIAFAPEAMAEIFGIGERTAVVWAGVVSTIIFASTLIQLRVGWKERHGEHRRACEVLVSVKNSLRDAKESGDEDGMRRAVERARLLIEGACPIPERDFLRLKALHLRKVYLSKRACTLFCV